jgi:hypothetical protein
MLDHEFYVRQKLRELEDGQMVRIALEAAPPAGKSGPPVISPVVRGTGRFLRRIGEGLESWAAPV